MLLWLLLLLLPLSPSSCRTSNMSHVQTAGWTMDKLPLLLLPLPVLLLQVFRQPQLYYEFIYLSSNHRQSSIEMLLLLWCLLAVAGPKGAAT